MSHLLRRSLAHCGPVGLRALSTSQLRASDRVNPAASSKISSDPFKPVSLRMDASGPGSAPPVSVQTMLRSVVEKCSGEKVK